MNIRANAKMRAHSATAVALAPGDMRPKTYTVSAEQTVHVAAAPHLHVSCVDGCLEIGTDVLQLLDHDFDAPFDNLLRTEGAR